MSTKSLTISSLLASLCALTLFVYLADASSVPAQTEQPQADAAKPGVPTEPTVTTATYGTWVLRCAQLTAQASIPGKSARPSTRACEVAQTVQVQGQPQPIAQVAIGRLPGETELTLTALLPANINLPGEVHLSGNGKTGAEEKGALVLAWQRCIGGACVATAKADVATLDVIRAGTEGQIRFADASGNLLSIPLSWTGLDQAITALDKIK